MASKRRILLDELDSWRAEGVMDEATHAFLRGRYANAPPSEELDGEPLARGAPRDEPGHRRSFAADAMQFVGGLLLGAGLVALVIFLDLQNDAASAYLLLALGALLLVPAAVGARRGVAPGLVEAGLSGGLVPMAVAVGLSLEQATTQLVVPLVLAAVSVGIVLLREGRGPSVLAASAAFAWSTAAATLLREDLFFGEPQIGARWAWFLALVAYGALLTRWKGHLWSAVSLGLLVAPATLAFAMLLEPLDLTSLGMELSIGAWLGALIGIGIWLGSRGLVTGAAAGLTIDAVAFAFDVGGPGTAVVVLLALGGLLVWQAEAVRRYFRGRPS